jgi:hypothetical protein
MNRCLAFIGALLLAFLSVSSACLAAVPSEWIRFTLEPEGSRSGEIRASFRTDDHERRDDNHWSTGFPPSELSGLDVIGFRSPGTRPLRFAVIREAGRLDCSGNGGESYAHGNCRFTPDARFTQLLASRGIRQDADDRWGMMALNVRRELIDAIAAAGYPTPSADDLMGMTAVGVDGRYIQELSRAGYRPKSIDTLIEFRALGITPEWIGGFVRIGYANIPADDLVQLKALGITPDFITGFEQAGYRRLPVDSLVQLKALGITPEFARWAAGQRSSRPDVDELVEMKIFDRRR